jgi:hypothetical protein
LCKSSRTGNHRWQYFFLTIGRIICKEREREGKWSHVATICAGPTKAIVALIGGATSLIIASSTKVIGTITPSHHRQGYWDQAKVIVFIKCKKQEHVNFKRLVNLRSQMFSATQKWDNIIEKLQNLTKSELCTFEKCAKTNGRG